MMMPTILEDRTKYTGMPIASALFFQTLNDCSAKDVGEWLLLNDRFAILSSSDGKIYDATTRTIYSDNEWPAYENNKEDTSRKLEILSKHGLDKAYVALCSWLKEHAEARRIIPNYPSAPIIEVRDLSYGYEIFGFQKQENKVVWGITCYDRVVKEKGVIAGKDMIYLLFDGEIIREAGVKGLVLLIQNNPNEDGLSEDKWHEYVPIPD